VLVTSAVPGEGKSTTAAQLAIACAQLGRKVLLVDANFRRPALHKLFGEDATAGFADVLQGKKSYAEAIRESEQPRLFLMPSGPLPRRDFDLIIIEAPHVLGASETPELAAITDGVLFFTKVGATGRSMFSEALSTILRTGPISSALS
jgi:Mrp family chromosome partitioning ATPase